MRNLICKLFLGLLAANTACVTEGAPLCEGEDCGRAQLEQFCGPLCDNLPRPFPDIDPDPPERCTEAHTSPDADGACVCDRFYQADSFGDCVPDLDLAIEACEFVWLRREARRADKLGNPFPMLDPSFPTWLFIDSVDGVDVELFPSEYASIRVRWPGSTAAEAVSLSCDVPLGWVAVPRTVSVAFDPVLTQVESGILGSDREDTTFEQGLDALGGLVLSWNRTAFKRTEASLQWFLDAGETPVNLAERLRRLREVPAEQAIEVQSLVDFAERQDAPILAIRFSSDDVEDRVGLPWIFGRTEFRDLRFVPRSDPPASATPDESLNEADIWPLFKAGIWQSETSEVTDCRGGAGARYNVIADDQVRELFRRSRADGIDVCVELLWTPAEGWDTFVTEACIDPDGALGPVSTRAVFDLWSLGLPDNLADLTCL